MRDIHCTCVLYPVDIGEENLECDFSSAGLIRELNLNPLFLDVAIANPTLQPLMQG